MLKLFVLLLVSNNIFSANSQNDTSFLIRDEMLMKLQMQSDLLTSLAEVQRMRHEAISLKLEQQAKVLDEITSKLGIKSDSDSKIANNNCSLCPRYTSSYAESTTVPSLRDQAFLVYKNMVEQGGDWTVIQRRLDNSTAYFHRDLASYKVGFGDVEGNFFIGLDKLHTLTTASPQELLITLTDFENVTKFAQYTEFAIGDESDSYALTILGHYIGDAGDIFRLDERKGMKFSTKDMDEHPANCAVMSNGVWWQKSGHARLTGPYLKDDLPECKFGNGIDWEVLHEVSYPLKTVKIKIRPKRN